MMTKSFAKRATVMKPLAAAAAVGAVLWFLQAPSTLSGSTALCCIPWLTGWACPSLIPRLLRRIDDHPVIRFLPVICISILAYAELSVLLDQSILLHGAFRTRSYDLGNYLNALWRFTWDGTFSFPLFDNRSLLGDHFAIGLALLAPLLLYFPTAETLLAAQAVAVVGASGPLYLLMRQISHSSVVAGLVSAIYLLHPATQLPVLYDFQDAKFIPFTFFLFLYCLRSRWTLLTLFSALLLLSFREIMAPVVCAIGAVATRSQRLCGALLVGIGAVYFVAIKVFVMPSLLGGEVSQDFYYTNLRSGHGSFFKDILHTLATSPQYVVYDSTTRLKFEYLALIIGVFGFLPLSRWKSTLILSAPLFCTVLSGWRPTYSIAFQYTYLIFPVSLWLATEVALERWSPSSSSPPMSFLLGAVAATIATNVVYGTFPGREKLHGLARGDVVLSELRAEYDGYTPLRATLAAIPRGDSVEASDSLIPHLSARSQIFRNSAGDRQPDWIVRWATEHFSPQNGGDHYQQILRNDRIAIWKRRGHREINP